MQTNNIITSATAVLVLVAATAASAGELRSNVAFNTGMGKKTADQPSNGVKVSYQVKLTGVFQRDVDCSYSRPSALTPDQLQAFEQTKKHQFERLV